MKKWLPTVSMFFLGFYLGSVGLKLTAFCRALSLEQVRIRDWWEVLDPLSLSIGSESFHLSRWGHADIGEGLAIFFLLAVFFLVGLWTTMGSLFFSQLLTGRERSIPAAPVQNRPPTRLFIGWVVLGAALQPVLVPRPLWLLALTLPAMAVLVTALVKGTAALVSGDWRLAFHSLIWTAAAGMLLTAGLHFSYFRDPQRSLITAAQNCDSRALERITQGRSKLNKPDKVGRTALTEAAAAGCLEGVNLLLDRGAAVDLPGGEWPFLNRPIHKHPPPSGVTALWIASARGDLEVVKLLLSRGAEPNRLCQESRRAGNMQLMVMGKCSPLAVSGKNLKVSAYLVAHGAQVNYPPQGDSNLHYAVMINDPALVRFLVEHGADMSRKDSQGRTPLQLARYWKKTDIVPYLEAAATTPPAE